MNENAMVFLIYCIITHTEKRGEGMDLLLFPYECISNRRRYNSSCSTSNFYQVWPLFRREYIMHRRCHLFPSLSVGTRDVSPAIVIFHQLQMCHLAWITSEEIIPSNKTYILFFSICWPSDKGSILARMHMGVPMATESAYTFGVEWNILQK